jgi:hypothetical protein
MEHYTIIIKQYYISINKSDEKPSTNSTVAAQSPYPTRDRLVTAVRAVNDITP